jgi:hypothetical protein
MLHKQLAYYPAFNFSLRSITHFPLYIRDNNFELSYGYGAFLTSAQQSAKYFVSAEFFTASILLNNNKRSFLHRLERSKPTAASLTFPAATNGFVVIGRP